MEEKLTIQEMIEKEVEKLLTKVQDGKFGIDNNFNRDEFEEYLNDQILILLYVWDEENEWIQARKEIID